MARAVEAPDAVLRDMGNVHEEIGAQELLPDDRLVMQRGQAVVSYVLRACDHTRNPKALKVLYKSVLPNGTKLD